MKIDWEGLGVVEGKLCQSYSTDTIVEVTVVKVDSRGMVEGKLCQSYSINTSDTIVEVTAVKIDWVVAGELCQSYPGDGPRLLPAHSAGGPPSSALGAAAPPHPPRP